MKKTLLSALALCLTLASQAQQTVKPQVNVVPAPASVEERTGTLTLQGTSARYFANSETAERMAKLYAAYLDANFGLKLQKGTMQDAQVIFSDDDQLPKEGYQLTVTNRKAVVQGHEAGLFYGLQTLQQISRNKTKTGLVLPAVTIKDQPRFGYRGVMLDVGRYYLPVPYIKQYIDVIASLKLNRFHWHLTEDQGWRIEIKKYPRLTTVGSQRKETSKGHLSENKFDGKPHGGFYTQEEVKDIVAYAAERFVTVVPEIEMPGHATAALASYPQLGCTGGPYEVSTKWGVHKEVFCAGNDETFTFLEDVLTEVLPLFPSQYIHIGGDECPKDRWKQCPKCQARMKALGLKDEHELQSYFIRRMEKFLGSKGRKIIGWDEILEGGLAPEATVMSWRGEAGGKEAARQRHDVIMTPNTYLYLDYYQGAPGSEPLAIGGYLPLDKVYSYEPLPKDLTPEEQKHIIGVQGNVWTEYIPSGPVSDYFTFPRAIALAEITWSPKEKKDYTDFRKRMRGVLYDLDKRGVNYRIPEAIGAENAVIVDPVSSGGEGVGASGISTAAQRAVVKLEPPMAGAVIRYTTDGSEPTAQSPVASGPIIIAPKKDETITLKYIVTIPETGRNSAVYSNTYTRKSYKSAVNVTPAGKGLKFQGFFKEFNAAAKVGGTADTSGVMTDISIRAFQRHPAFGAVFEGFVKVEEDGLYEIAATSDDGSLVFIDGDLVVDNDGEHAPVTQTGIIPLRKGYHRIKVQYFDAGGGDMLKINIGVKGKQSLNLRNALFN
ncbi:family 20 glycosylhydrolase [Chitinophaga caseinilytica]|uniref:beta-N-acetylhexosaminidase n=1 Tax=Chitinophaga caseinilytica TaxID=2267521 RepID=A0ABZ2Z1N9_9BACT